MEDDLCLFYFWISAYCIKEDIKREKNIPFRAFPEPPKPFPLTPAQAFLSKVKTWMTKKREFLQKCWMWREDREKYKQTKKNSSNSKHFHFGRYQLLVENKILEKGPNIRELSFYTFFLIFAVWYWNCRQVRNFNTTYVKVHQHRPSEYSDGLSLVCIVYDTNKQIFILEWARYRTLFYWFFPNLRNAAGNPNRDRGQSVLRF